MIIVHGLLIATLAVSIVGAILIVLTGIAILIGFICTVLEYNGNNQMLLAFMKMVE